jgi:hypothetical protein
VKPIRNGADPAEGVSIRCAVAACGTVQATADELPGLRQIPGSFRGQPIPPSFLKHADEQTVVSMAALFQAIERHGLRDTSFTDWAALAAPRYLGRITTSQALQRFRGEGAWGISPHLIPHRTLHAISGTISQALQMHGPNLGVGGGPDAAIEVMRVAPAFLADPDLPGLWVVMSGWNHEPTPTVHAPENSTPMTNGFHPISHCQAVALALTSGPRESDGFEIHFHTTATAMNGHRPKHSLPTFSLENLYGALHSHSTSSSHWTLGDSASVELKHVMAGAEIMR